MGEQLSATVPDSSFNVVLTNPPFGTKLKIDAESGQREGYQVCKKWIYDRETNEWTPKDEFQPREIGIVFLGTMYQFARARRSPSDSVARHLSVLPLVSMAGGLVVQELHDYTLYQRPHRGFRTTLSCEDFDFGSPKRKTKIRS